MSYLFEIFAPVSTQLMTGIKKDNKKCDLNSYASMKRFC